MKKTFQISTLSQAVLLAIAMPAMANGTDDVAVLDEITVSGGSMYRMGEVPIHQAKSAVAVNREELDKQAVNKVDEIARYQAGFTNQVFGEDTNTNWFRVRGAEVSQAVDGLPTFSYGFFTPYVNSFGLEAVEITKGADAITFGAAQSGGLINYVSKRPHKEQVGQGEFKLNIGNNTQYGFSADYTGALADNARYRFVTSYGGKDGQWANTKNETLYVAPSFEFDLTDKTRLTLLTSYQRDAGVPSSNFLPQEGTIYPAPNGKYIDRKSNMGDPVNDKELNRQYSLGYELEHAFNNGITVNSAYRFNQINNFHRGSYIYSSIVWAPGLSAPSKTNYTMDRSVVINDGKARSHTLDNHLTWNIKNEWLENTLIAGQDYRYQRIVGLYDGIGGGRTTPTNLFNPSVGYGQAQSFANLPTIDIKARQLGFYLQNRTRIAQQVVATVGIRHDRAKVNEQYLAKTQSHSHTSYSGSLMYEAPFGLNPYVGYSEAFTLPIGQNGTGKLYSPTITKQIEAGVKYLPTWVDGSITLTAFQAKDKNAMFSKYLPAWGMFQDSAAENHKRQGIELQADINLLNNWNLALAYAYQKSVEKRADKDVLNPRVPKHTLAAKTDYTISKGVLEGLTLGAGIRYVGASVSKTDEYALHSNGIKVPSTTLVDLMARYQFNKNWVAQLNVDNVTNRRYVSSCDWFCYYGAGRNINASMSYKF